MSSDGSETETADIGLSMSSPNSNRRSSARSSSKNRAVFFDRDGTLIDDVGYLNQVEDVRILPGAIEAVRLLEEWGYRVVVVTNQSAVARGMLSEKELSRIHGFISRKFAEKGGTIGGIYYCPHHPEGVVSEFRKVCDCRKPEPGLLLKGAHDLDIDLSVSWMIGDCQRDVLAGKRAGCRAILIGQAFRQEDMTNGLPPDERADYFAPDVLEATKWILRADS